MIYLIISVLAIALMYGLLGIMHLLNRANSRKLEKVGICIMLLMMYGGCWFAVSLLAGIFR